MPETRLITPDEEAALWCELDRAWRRQRRRQRWHGLVCDIGDYWEEAKEVFAVLCAVMAGALIPVIVLWDVGETGTRWWLAAPIGLAVVVAYVAWTAARVGRDLAAKAGDRDA